MDIDNYNVSQFNQGVNSYLSQMANYNAQVNFYAQQSAEQKQRDENISQLLEMTGLGGMEIIKNFMKTKAWKALSGYVENQLNNNVDIQQIKSELMNKTKSYLRDNFNIDLDKPSNGLLNKALTDLNLSSNDLKSIAQGNTDVLEQKMTQRLQQELNTRTGMTPEQIQQRLLDIQDQAQTVKTKIQQQAEEMRTQAQQQVEDLRTQAQQQVEGMRTQAQQQVEDLRTQAEGMRTQAQQQVEDLRTQAEGMRTQAQQQVEGMRTQAEGMRTQAQQQVEGIRTQAQQQVEGMRTQAQQRVQSIQDQFETLRDTARTTITPDVMSRPTLTFEEQRARFQSRLNELEAPEVKAPEIKMWRSSQSLIQRGTPLEPLNIPEQQPTELSTTAGDLLGSLGEQGALIGAGIGESYIRDRPTRFATEQATNIGGFLEQTTGAISKSIRGAYQSIKSSLLPTREPPVPANPDTEVIDEERPVELQDMASQAPTETAPAEAPTTTTTTTTTATTAETEGAVDTTLGTEGAVDTTLGTEGAVDATLGEVAGATSETLAIPAVGEIVEGGIGLAAIGFSLYYGLKDLFSSDDDTPPPPEMTVPSYQAGI